MAGEVQYDLCPETGIGCLLVNPESGMRKIDLMPDEAAQLKELVNSGDMDGARAMILSVDPGAESAITDDVLKALAQEMS